MIILIIPTFQMPKIAWLGDGRTETQIWTVGLRVQALKCVATLPLSHIQCQLSLCLGREERMGEIQQKMARKGE